MSQPVSSDPHCYRFWSEEEDAIVIAAWHERKTLTEIAHLLKAFETERGLPPYRTPDTVRMRVQILRKKGVDLPIRPAGVMRWRHQPSAKVILDLIEAKRAEKERMRALREALREAKEAQKAQMEAQKAQMELERLEKAALENLKGWPIEGTPLFTDNLTKAELDRENVGRIHFVGSAPFLAGRAA